ncbi:MAG TPA: large conductance mechanosensitive channel protein MscL [Oscillatoriaceae cyanobacterium]
MSWISEFRAFVQRGNVVDLAIAVVLGAAFGRVVTSFTNDVLMPPVGLALGRTDFSSLFIPLNGAHYPSLAIARAAGAPVIAYGTFINTIIDFILIALSVFWIVKLINRFYATGQSVTCPFCTLAISPQATRCPHCTAELKPAVTLTRLPETATQLDEASQI